MFTLTEGMGLGRLHNKSIYIITDKKTFGEQCINTPRQLHFIKQKQKFKLCMVETSL